MSAIKRMSGYLALISAIKSLIVGRQYGIIFAKAGEVHESSQRENYEKKNLLSLVPVKPEEFINALVKRLEHRIEEE